MVTDRTPDYDKYAKYHVAAGTEEDKDTKNIAVGRILKRYNAKTVLDLACGTGSQVFWLARRGYEVVGSDISAGSLRMARRRARMEKRRIRFIRGDMRNVRAGKFDAAISIFNAVGHLSKAGFEKAMRNAYANLNDGGIYAFDIMNAHMNGRLEDGLLVNSIIQSGDTRIHKLQVCRIDRKTGIVTMDEVFCTWKGQGKLNVGKPVRWTMQIYAAKELREMLERSGFEVIGQYSWPDGSEFSEKGSESILTVAKKSAPRS